MLEGRVPPGCVSDHHTRCVKGGGRDALELRQAHISVSAHNKHLRWALSVPCMRVSKTTVVCMTHSHVSDAHHVRRGCALGFYLRLWPYQ
jgi:hypothetical protein